MCYVSFKIDIINFETSLTVLNCKLPKCANPKCYRVYKFSRNSLDINNVNYCCGMGCALESFKNCSISAAN